MTDHAGFSPTDRSGQILSAEHALIGAIVHAIMGNKDDEPIATWLGRVTELVRAEHFADPLAGRAYSLLLKAPGMAEAQWAAALEADPFLADLIKSLFKESWVNPATWKFYAETVISAWQLRRVRSTLHQLTVNADHTRPTRPGEVDEFLAEAEHEMMQVLRDGQKATPISVAGVLRSIMDPAFKPPGLAFGISTLDEMMGGMEAGDMCVVAARTSVGKSAFALQCALNVAFAGTRVLFISFEMDAPSVLKRAVCSLSGHGLAILDRKMADRPEWAAMRDAADRIVALGERFQITDCGGNWTLAGVHAAISRYRPEFVVVDYLQLMRGDNPKATRFESVTASCQGIKAMAVEFGIPLMAVCQLNRQADNDGSPRLHHLRDSGQIEQDANQVILLSSDPEERQKPTVTLNADVAKNRQGSVGLVMLQFEKPCYRITVKPLGTTATWNPRNTND